jgi:hypothetical protein
MKETAAQKAEARECGGRKIMSTHDERRANDLDPAELLAEIAALRRRLDDLEAVPAARAVRRKPGRLVAAVAVLGVLAGVSVVYGQNAKDALFVSPSGEVRIGVSLQFPDGTKQMTSAETLLKGAVIAFDLEKCPAGWSEYQPAYGRFIRGLDRGAAPVDPDGRRPLAGFQPDAVQKITGRLLGVQGGANVAWPWGFRPNNEPGNAFFVSLEGGTYNKYNGDYGAPGGWGTTAVFDASRSVRTANETRPVNVALLYCKKQ